MSEDEFSLSRRKALAALGTIGVASAGAGLGTSAYFSDQETFENNQLTAGTLDLKVGWQEHYSDWKDDPADDGNGFPGAETTYAEMPGDGDTADLVLPPGGNQSDAQPIELSFVDPETGDEDTDSQPGTDDGGRQFLRNTQQSSVNGGIYNSNSLCGEPNDADGRAVFEVDDVKPGDFGFGLFRLELCDNPGYLWLNGGLESASENGYTEPELDDPDEDGPNSDGTVELLDEIQVAYSVGTTNNLAATDPGESPLPLPSNGSLENQTTLRQFLEGLSSGNGVELSGDIDAEEGGGTGSQGCFSGGGNHHYASVVWWLPIDHGNQVQSDSVTFDLGFYTEQCRHNDGSGPYPNDPWLAQAQTSNGGVFWNHRGDDNEFALSPGDTFEDLPSPGQPIYVNLTDSGIDVKVDDGNGGTSVTLGAGAYDESEDFHNVGSGADWVRIPSGVGTPHPSGGDNYEFVGITETSGGYEVEWRKIPDP